MSYRNFQSYSVDKALLAYATGNCFGLSISVSDGGNIPIDAQANRTIPQGMFLAKGTDGLYRFLPRAKVTTAITTSDSVISLSPVEGLRTGDVLSISHPYTVLTITTVAATNTQTITVNGSTATATATTAVNADMAVLVETAVNSTFPLNTMVYAIAAGDDVYLFPMDGSTLYTVTEGGTATATLSAADMAYNGTALGTISSIDAANGQVTLGANSAIAVPVGVAVGAPISEITGLTVESMDFTEQQTINVRVLTESSGVRKKFLPYYEPGLKSLFPNVIFSDSI